MVLRLKEVESRLLNKIDEMREDIIDLLRRLVRIPSVTGEEGKIQRFISNYLEDLGLVIDVFEPDIEKLRRSPYYEEVEICLLYTSPSPRDRG